MGNKKIKVCYILPKFNLDTDTHHAHIYDLINLVSNNMTMGLIIEEAKSDIAYFKNIKDIYVQKFRWLPFRILENLFYVKLMRVKGYQKFYVHYSYVGAFNASLVARLTGGKVWYWNCGMMWLFGRDKFLVLVLRMVNYLVTGVKALVPGYSNYADISPDKIKIMPNWIDIKNYQNVDVENFQSEYDLPANKKIILFVHRIAERKGAHYIVPVAKKFKHRQDVLFVVAGDGPYQEKLIEEIEEAGLGNIKLLGKVPNRQVNKLLALSYIYFMPSEEEGFPRTLIEAMAAGLPFVASDIGGVREISPEVEQEFIYKVGNIEGYAQGIKMLLDNPIAYEQVKAGCLNHVRQYDINMVKDKFINLFQ